jgi:hypothetical protein
LGLSTLPIDLDGAPLRVTARTSARRVSSDHRHRTDHPRSSCTLRSSTRPSIDPLRANRLARTALARELTALARELTALAREPTALASGLPWRRP